MQVAKALTGKYAGQPIAANKQGLTHGLCREWKLYCPECYQFVHLRKSDKISSYFAHYDVEDKECTDRTKYSSNNTISSIENCAKGQDLEVIQLEFESILFEKYDEFKIDELKDVENITNKCKKYFIGNRKNIIKSCAQNNNFKHRGISRDVLNILFIDMNKDILKKLIHYAVAINPECYNQLDNITESTIRSIIDSIIKIIADIDWNKPKSIIPENTNYSLEEENNTYNSEEENDKDSPNFQERLTNLEANEIIADIGYVCLNDGVRYYGRTAVSVVNYCLKQGQDSLGNIVPTTYSQPIYCKFGLSKVKKVNFLTLYPEKFYLNDPRGSLTKQYKTLEKEQELRHVVYRANDLPEANVTVIRSQAFKSNGQLRDFKTPGGYVGGTKKTKSKIASGGKSTNNVDTPIFNLGQKWNHQKLGMVQLTLNPNSLEIDLINYHNGQTIARVAKITGFNGELYQWAFYKGYETLESDLVQRINSLIQPKKVDGKGDINLPQIKILDGMKQQQIQKVTEERFGYHISSKTKSKVRSKAWKYLETLANKEDHRLFGLLHGKHHTEVNWQEVFSICEGLGLIGKRTAK